MFKGNLFSHLFIALSKNVNGCYLLYLTYTHLSLSSALHRCFSLSETWASNTKREATLYFSLSDGKSPIVFIVLLATWCSFKVASRPKSAPQATLGHPFAVCLQVNRYVSQ